MSIDVKELRIGNKFLNEQGGIDEVYCIEEGGINWYAPLYDPDDKTYEEVVNPIPLTNDILEKCGFKENTDKSYYWKYPNLRYWENKGMTIVLQDGEFRKYNYCEDDFYSTMYPELTSLHQLQNLYFALTNTELTIEQLNK